MSQLSFIIPVYNAEKYLEECLQSILCQTLKDIELLCIDDGSTDSSPTILQKFSELDSRVKAITVPNGGVSAARNRGLQEASGEYIWFVDSDDFLADEHAAAHLYEKARTAEADIVVFSYVELDQQSGKRHLRSVASTFAHHEHPVKTTDLGKDIFTMPGQAWFKIYRKEFLSRNSIRFDPSYAFHEDFKFLLEVMLGEGTILFVQEHFYVYRVAAGTSACDNVNRHYDDVFRVVDDTYRLISSSHCDDATMASYLANRINSVSYWSQKVSGPAKKAYYVRMRKLFLELEAEHGSLIRQTLPNRLRSRYKKILRRPYWIVWLKELFHGRKA